MSVMFLILPLALIMALIALTAFLRATKSGQYDDMETPPWRALFNDRD